MWLGTMSEYSGSGGGGSGGEFNLFFTSNQGNLSNEDAEDLVSWYGVLRLSRAKRERMVELEKVKGRFHSNSSGKRHASFSQETLPAPKRVYTEHREYQPRNPFPSSLSSSFRDGAPKLSRGNSSTQGLSSEKDTDGRVHNGPPRSASSARKPIQKERGTYSGQKRGAHHMHENRISSSDPD